MDINSTSDAPISRRSCPAHTTSYINPGLLRAVAADLESAGFGRAVAVLLARHAARVPAAAETEASHEAC